MTSRAWILIILISLSLSSIRAEIIQIYLNSEVVDSNLRNNSLTLNHYNFTHIHKDAFCYLPTNCSHSSPIVILDLQNNFIRHLSDIALKPLFNALYIHLSWNRLTSINLNVFRSSTHLISLDLSNNRIRKITGDNLRYKYFQLERLFLQYNLLTDLPEETFREFATDEYSKHTKFSVYGNKLKLDCTLYWIIESRQETSFDLGNRSQNFQLWTTKDRKQVYLPIFCTFTYNTSRCGKYDAIIDKFVSRCKDKENILLFNSYIGQNEDEIEEEPKESVQYTRLDIALVLVLLLAIYYIFCNKGCGNRRVHPENSLFSNSTQSERHFGDFDIIEDLTSSDLSIKMSAVVIDD